MYNAKTLFSVEQAREIELAITKAESQTDCEIVPVVATQSGRYDRAEDIVGISLALLVATLFWWFYPRVNSEVGDWEAGSPVWGLALFTGSTVITFILGAILASKTPWLRRMFIPGKQVQEEVTQRARETFFDQRVHHTKTSNGLMIYISLFERRTMILADQQVLEKAGQPFLDQLCEQLTEGIREGNVTQAFCAVIQQAEAVLAESFPRSQDDINELENPLVLID